MGPSVTRLWRQTRRVTTLLALALEGLRRPRSAGASPVGSALWLHKACAAGLRTVGAELAIAGQPPEKGLIVSNHISYLDILAFGAAAPCVFVSKAEVERWPIIGRYAREAGCAFVRRHDKVDAARANLSVAESLRGGVPVVLFPEGTTTDGKHVLRFHSTMLQPAIDVQAPVTPCAIRYELDGGDSSREICWWGDMTLLPHVWNLLGKRGVRARIAFGQPIPPGKDRKQLSHDLRERVTQLLDQLQESAGEPDCGKASV